MKCVKLTAKPDTWFKAGTEVYDYDAKYDHKKRITLEYWNQAVSEGGICVRGIRVCEDNPNENGMGCKPGEERIDGEWCSCDEFDSVIVDENLPEIVGTPISLSGWEFTDSAVRVSGSYSIHPPPKPIINVEDSNEELDLDRCEQCDELAWDGYICHACGVKNI